MSLRITPTTLRRAIGDWLAFLAFWWKRRFLRTSCPQEKGDVLLVSFTNWAPRLCLEGLIAAAFRCAGYTPVILNKREHRWSERYFRACGVTTFLHLNDALERAQQRMNDADALTLLARHNSFTDLFDFRQNGIGVGRHVLSTVVRQKLQGSIGFDDPATQALLRTFFPLSLRTAIAAEEMFAQRRPAAVLFLEKGYTPYGELFDAAILHGLNVIQYFSAHRSDLLVMKRYGQENRFAHPHSLSAKSWNAVRAMPWSPERDTAFMQELRRAYADGTWFNRKKMLEGKKMKTPEEIRRQLGLDPTKKTAVIFSHILWDATFFFGTNLYEDYEQWLVATVKAACANPAVNWIVKLHPDYTWKMRGTGQSTPRDIVALAADVGELPPHVTIVPPETDISTYSFFDVMDYVITVRGTIGIEAPCFGIPVLTAGTGRYSGLGFTEDSATQEEYLAKLATIQDLPRLSPERAMLARKHAHALFDLRPLTCTSFAFEGRKTADGTLENELRLNIGSWKQLCQAADLKAFTDWVLHSRDEDYLAPLRTHEERTA